MGFLRVDIANEQSNTIFWTSSPSVQVHIDKSLLSHMMISPWGQVPFDHPDLYD